VHPVRHNAALRLRAHAALARGDEEALGACAERMAAFSARDLVGVGTQQRELAVRALRAALHSRRGEHDRALALAREGAVIMAASPPPGYDLLLEYAAIADVLLRGWEGAGEGDAAWRAPATQAARVLKRYAGIFPVGMAASRGVQTRLALLGARVPMGAA
jgi:hypothetical protein